MDSSTVNEMSCQTFLSVFLRVEGPVSASEVPYNTMSSQIRIGPLLP